MSDQPQLVFVYGTLMSGHGNHRILGGARYVSDASTTDSTWTMVDLHAFPGVLSGGSDSIQGEVYEVNTATVCRMDRLEGHPRFYRRRLVKVTLWDGDGPQHVDAWMYVLPRDRYGSERVVPGGDWRGREHVVL